jgi:hypothetical protein
MRSMVVMVMRMSWRMMRRRSAYGGVLLRCMRRLSQKRRCQVVSGTAVGTVQPVVKQRLTLCNLLTRRLTEQPCLREQHLGNRRLSGVPTAARRHIVAESVSSVRPPSRFRRHACAAPNAPRRAIQRPTTGMAGENDQTVSMGLLEPGRTVTTARGTAFERVPPPGGQSADQIVGCQAILEDLQARTRCTSNPWQPLNRGTRTPCRDATQPETEEREGHVSITSKE